MGPAGNTGGNTHDLAPDPALRGRMKEHGIHWHKKGGWARKFPGDANRTYFGRVSPAEAVKLCNREEDRRKRGLDAEVRLTNLRLRQAVNLFLTHLDAQLAGGKIGPAQRASYGDELDRLVKSAGRNRRLSDFCKLSAPEELFAPLRKLALARGVFAAEKHVVQVRTFLDWCSTTRRFVPAPFYADAFDAPGDKEKRAARKKTRREKGEAFWTPPEARRVADAAKADGVHRHAQVLLMLNGGMGSTDLSYLEDGDVDWDRRCVHTDRSKTLVPRVVPLWPETIVAMRASRAERPKPERPEWAGRFFLTMHGRPLVTEELAGKERRKTKRTDSLKNWFYVLVNGTKKRPGVLADLKRHGAGAYTLRSVFLTLARGHGGDPNLDAVILGTQFPGRPVMEFYLRGDLREKLVSVVEHVRRQIWPEAS